MALNICLEAIIRLLFEISRVLFGDITLLWRGGYFDSEIPALISTLKWVFVFTLVAMLSKNQLLKKFIILGIPFLVGLLSYVPFIGGFLSVGAGILTMRIVVMAWVFVLWSDDRIHWLLRIFATPGIVIFASLNAVFPYTSVFGNLGYAFLMGYLPEIAAFMFLVASGLIIIISPLFLCETLNFVLTTWETVRYEGWSTAIFGCLVFIKNKAIQVKDYF